MKKLLIISIIMSFISIVLFSQNNYYWSNGKKVIVTHSDSKQIVYVNEKSDSFLKSDQFSSSKFSHFKRLGGYRIVHKNSKELKSINSEMIKLKVDCIVSEDADTLFPTPLIVAKFKKGYIPKDLEHILKENNVKHLSTSYKVDIFEVQNIQKVFKVANEIYQTGIVEWCRPNFIRNTEKPTVLNDKQYYIQNKERYCGAFSKDINVVQAWTITEGCDNIRVAVLDDGVEDHPALEDSNGNSRVVNGYSVPGVPANGRPGSNRQHGQCCAGIIAATHSNNIRGIAPNVMIVPVNLGFEIQDELEWFEAMNWAWDPNGGNADILSNSWGPSNGASGHELYIQAINNAQIYGRGGNIENDIPGLGSIVVFSSGNNGLNEVSDYAKAAIAVGAINQSDTPAELNYSLKTDKRYTNIGPNQDLVAYGGDSDCQFWGFACNGEGDILTIDRVGSNGYTSGDYFEHFSGTSAACPQISGAAALILSINPSLSRTEVENMLFSAATDLGSPGKDNTYGYGKLNVYESCLEAVKSLNKNFGLNNNFLSYSKTGSDVPMTFVGSPGCGVASGIYVCDIYKAEGTMPQTSIYVGDGLSGANPNTGEYNVITSVNNDNINLMTFFYYVKSNIGGQVINRWVPQNPANLWAREYCSVPEENVVFNGTINSSENKELYASESIILSSGFEAKLGASFRAAPSSSTDEFICLSNPAQSMAFKSGIINQNELISSNEVFEIDMTDIKIYPNPSKGNFKVSISKELGDRAEIKIYNLNGELKFSKFIESKNQDFVFSEIPGVYLVKIIKGENIYYKKIVIQ